MNVAESISQGFRSIPTRTVAIGSLTAVGIIGITALFKATDASFNDVIGIITGGCATASIITCMAIIGTSLSNAIALIFARFGRVETAANLLNRPIQSFVNQHTLGVITFASITCAVMVFGLTYLNEN